MFERMVSWQIYGPLITRIFRPNRQTPVSRESVEYLTAITDFEVSLKEGSIHEWYPPDERGHAQADGTTNPVKMWKSYLEDLGEGTTFLPLSLRTTQPQKPQNNFSLETKTWCYCWT